MARPPAKKRSFHQELVLNRWMLSHFRGKSLAVLKERLGADRHEGLDDDGQTRFFHELVRDLFEYDRITNAELRRYDLNIVAHWKAITEKRNVAEGAVLTMKYFQYLSLLFSEIYLDWYFNHRQDLLDGLNAELEAYRAEEGAEPFRPYTADDLNKIAYWSATGSGKTLLLHVNIRQYADILRRVFNAESRQRLKLINLKSSKGELALRVGTSEPFGLINIGDDSGFYKTADDLETKGFDTEGHDFAGSLFHQINLPDSRMSMLVGSRKFTEGWSSWRVSTMGLLNMGRGEGSQIIQLFGRGVRLKGRDMSLKRSLPPERPKGSYLEKLEALNIFGVRADYMATFREYLIEEGITPSDEIITLDFPTRSNLPTGRRLKTLKLRDGYKDNQAKGFKRVHFPWLYEVPAEFEGKIKPPHVTLDLYPRVEAMASDGKGQADDGNVRHTGKIDRAIMAMFDWDRLFLSLQQYKLQKSWSNLRLDEVRLRQFCESRDDWYTLFMPANELTFSGFTTILKLQDVLLQLLCDYTDRFYQGLKAAYEGQYFDLDEVTEEHGSMLKLYQFEIENSDAGESYLNRLKALQEIVAAGNIGEASKWHAANMVAISFDRHLFYPLLCPVKDGTLPLKMRPLGLGAESEVRFVQDLMAFYQSDAGRKAIGKRSLYLLRNADTKAKGLGFALAGNFYPDFLLWLVDEETGHQSLSFLDPKGIRNLDLDDPKFGLFEEVKKLEAEIGDGTLSLNAFILSETNFGDLINTSRVNRADLEARNVLFMDASGTSYIDRMIEGLS